MTWLVTFSPQVDLATANSLLVAHGAKPVSEVDRIRMETGEWVATTEGPANLSASLKGCPEVRGVHPSSGMTYY